MAIARLNPDAAPAIVTTVPDAIPEPNKSIFTPLVPESKINSLLKYVEGYPWTVDFYGQILNSHNTLEGFDPGSPNLTQPYYKVERMILQVDSPLDSSYDTATGVTTVSGSALMPFSVTPNAGDVFIAQVDSGEDAIFHITAVTRKTHRKDSLYAVSYTLYAFTSDRPTFVSQLNARVNETYYFNNDTNFFNRDVLIKPSVKEAIDRLNAFMAESRAHYFRLFGQNRTGALILPGTTSIFYDPRLVDFIAKTVEVSQIDSKFFRATYFSDYVDQPSLLDCLLGRRLPAAGSINTAFSFVSVASLPSKARFGAIAFLDIDYILHPVSPLQSHISGGLSSIPVDYADSPKTPGNYASGGYPVIQAKNNDQLYSTPLLHELFIGDSYLVSPQFYQYLTDHGHYASLSYIELLIAKFLNKEAIAREDLAVAVETYLSWPLLHQFYLLPILWFLIKNTL